MQLFFKENKGYLYAMVSLICLLLIVLYYTCKQVLIRQPYAMDVFKTSFVRYGFLSFARNEYMQTGLYKTTLRYGWCHKEVLKAPYWQ